VVGRVEVMQEDAGQFKNLSTDFESVGRGFEPLRARQLLL
jgi:hypothetical protein